MVEVFSRKIWEENGNFRPHCIKNLTVHIYSFFVYYLSYCVFLRFVFLVLVFMSWELLFIIVQHFGLTPVVLNELYM